MCRLVVDLVVLAVVTPQIHKWVKKIKIFNLSILETEENVNVRQELLKWHDICC